MKYEKLSLISEGKTKRMWETNDPRYAIAEFSDDAMMYHAKKKLYFPDKGIYCNEINSILMSVLTQNNVPTHFVEKYSANESVVKRADMIPMEVIVYNYCCGRMTSRIGLPYHSKLRSPVLEFCYKNDELGDPVINEYHAYAMSLCTQEEMNAMCYEAMRINKVLIDLMKPLGILVADFKVEFGRVHDRLVVADEITPNVARFWDNTTLHKYDDDGKNPQKEYEVILERLKKL